MNMDYTFCRGPTPDGKSQWHLRPVARGDENRTTLLTTTPSLCGLVAAKKGWDIVAPLSKRNLEVRACRECVRLFERARERNCRE